MAPVGDMPDIAWKMLAGCVWHFDLYCKWWIVDCIALGTFFLPQKKVVLRHKTASG